jgi:hypothetical protein
LTAGTFWGILYQQNTFNKLIYNRLEYISEADFFINQSGKFRPSATKFVAQSDKLRSALALRLHPYLDDTIALRRTSIPA